MTRNIDELSNLQTRSVEPEKYFGEMDLEEEQVEKRIEYTKKANELFDIILILLLTMRDNGEVDYSYARGLLETWLLSLIAEFVTPDDYLIDYATDTAYNFVDTTQKNIDKDWYTSSDRALFNAENSANDVLNYSEYEQAIKEGKTHKQWITESDNRVRESHKDVIKKPIPIKEYFQVGMTKMRFPKDYEYAAAFPEELVNCRCTIKYLPEITEDKDYEENEQAWTREKNPDDSVSVNWNKYNDDVLHDRLSKIESDETVVKSIFNRSKTILQHRDKSHYEDLAFVDSRNGKSKINTKYDYYEGGKSACVPNSKMYKMLKNAPEHTIISIHNHPASTMPSADDIFAAYLRNYKYGLVLGHKGDIIKYSLEENAWINEDTYGLIQARLDKLYEAMYNKETTTTVESAIHGLAGYGINVEVFK